MSPEPQPAPEPAARTDPQQKSVPAPPVAQKPPSRDGGARSSTSFAVYALSRGSGVPPEALEAQLKIQKLAEADRARGLRVSIETTRIGIEGERRLCVAYQDSRTGARALARARAIVKGVALVNLVVEPCTATSKTQKKEATS